MSIVLPFKHDSEHAKLGEWINSSDENSLEEMAKLIEDKVINVDSVPGSKDHAIPSPVAHIMNFRKKLLNRDDKAVSIWKGMLAAIALRDNYGLNIEMRLIELTSTLGMVIRESLEESCNWPKDTNQMPVFFKDGIPFAFGAPDISICPYKNFPKDLFSGLEWYEETEEIWNDPPASIRTKEAELRGTLTAQGKKLYYWLRSLNRALPDNNPYENIYNEYLQSALFNVELSNEDEENYSAISPNSIYREALSEPKESLLNALNIRRLVDTAIPPDGALQVNELFADNVLIYVPKKVDDIEQETYMPFQYLTNLNDYSDKIDNAYIIPPISKKLIERIKKYNGDIVIESISYKDSDCRGILNPTKQLENLSLTCTVTVKFLKEGQTIHYKWKYDQTKIVWTDALPYIVLWPNVNLPSENWMSYYLAVAKHNRVSDSNRSEYEFVSDSERFFRLENINITATTRNNSKIDEYTVRSPYNPVKNDSAAVEYKMFHSKTIFDTIGLHYRKDQRVFEIGFLIIDHHKGSEYKSNTINFDKHYVVGIDFGTTSTNVFIKDEHSDREDPRSISSPGKYLLELTRTDNKQDQLDNEIYFFTRSHEVLGKIFTAGKLFNAKLGGDPVDEIPYVAGKYIKIDHEQFWEPLSRNVDFSTFGIYFRLKFSHDLGEMGRTTEAARLFILSLLQTALLECRLQGAEAVKIHYSYPFESSGYDLNMWNEVLNLVDNDFSDDPHTVTYDSKTESEAAGEYFKRYSARLGASPILRRGYAIADIGGGTTDVSIWRKPDEESHESFIRAQHSFKYAGQMLVNRTLIQSIRNEKELKKYIQLNEMRHLEKIADAYAVARIIKRPIGSTWNPGVIKANSILEILLDNNCFIPRELLKNANMTVFVKLKYIALFYLIARYMKAVDDHDIYNNEAKYFTLHLAGCGAKGLQFCTESNDLSSFSDNEFGRAVINMMKAILDLPDGYAFKIMAPLCEDKEEVVTGLVMTETRVDRENQIRDEIQDRVDPADIGIDYSQAEKSYQEMLDIFKIHCTGQLGYPNTEKGVLQFFEISDANRFLRQEFRGAFDGIVRDLQSSNPNKETIYDNFSLLMLSDLIDQFIANPQRFIK
jgi:hypothetical protein